MKPFFFFVRYLIHFGDFTKNAFFVLGLLWMAECAALGNGCKIHCMTAWSDFNPQYNPHSIYLLANVMGSTTHMSIDGATIDGSRALGGWVVGYQYLKLHRFYFNAEGVIGFGGSSLQGYLDETPIPSSLNHLPVFTQIQLRLGAPINIQERIIIPYFGLGWLSFANSWSNNGLCNLYPYLAWGIRLPELTGRLCHVGLDLSILGPIYNSLSYQGKYVNFDEGFSSAGMRLSFPCTGLFSIPLKWNWRIEPFLIAPSFSELQLFYGLSAGFVMHF